MKRRAPDAPADDPEQQQEPPKVRKLKRGLRLNTLVRPRRYYGFLTRTEGPKGGPWHLRLECTPGAWMDAAWNALPTNDRDELLAFLATDTFAVAYRRATYADLQMLARVDDDYGSLLGDDTLPPLRLAMYEIYVDEEELERLGVPLVDLKIQHWYEMAIVGYHGNELRAIGTLREEIGEAPFLGEPSAHALLRMPLLEERATWWAKSTLSQAVMHALHAPHAPPPPPVPKRDPMQL